MIQPSFQHDAMQQYASIMLHCISTQIAQWHVGCVLDIHACMMQYTREVICDVLFGGAQGGTTASRHSLAVSQREIGDAVSVVFGDLRSEILYLSLWRRLPFSRNRRWHRAATLLHRSIQHVIATRRASRDTGQDLLGDLLRARDAHGNPMSDSQLLDEILTFFLAGHETAALSLTWSAYLLATNPHTQDLARQELAGLPDGATFKTRPLPAPALSHRRRQRSSAPLSTRLEFGPQSTPARSPRPPSGPAENRPLALSLSASSRSPLVSRSRSFRARALAHWRAPASFYLSAIRYRPARLHRSALRHGRSCTRLGCHPETVSSLARLQRACPREPVDHFATQTANPPAIRPRAVKRSFTVHRSSKVHFARLCRFRLWIVAPRPPRPQSNALAVRLIQYIEAEIRRAVGMNHRESVFRTLIETQS